jgi:hypothetical protein
VRGVSRRLDFRDERDQMIEMRTNKVAYWTGAAIPNVIIIHLIATEVFARGREPPLDLSSSMLELAFRLARESQVALEEMFRFNPR